MIDPLSSQFSMFSSFALVFVLLYKFIPELLEYFVTSVGSTKYSFVNVKYITKFPAKSVSTFGNLLSTWEYPKLSS